MIITITTVPSPSRGRIVNFPPHIIFRRCFMFANAIYGSRSSSTGTKPGALFSFHSNLLKCETAGSSTPRVKRIFIYAVEYTTFVRGLIVSNVRQRSSPFALPSSILLTSIFSYSLAMQIGINHSQNRCDILDSPLLEVVKNIILLSLLKGGYVYVSRNNPKIIHQDDSIGGTRIYRNWLRWRRTA